MGNPMKIRTKSDGRVTEVKVLMSHVMETGLRKNAQGELVPAQFIQFVTITWQDRPVLRAQWGPAVSANPFLSFKFEGGQKGDKLKVSWADNKGDTRSDEVTIN